MERTYYVRTEVPGAGHVLVPVTVSDEPWKGDLSVTGPEAVTPRRITDAARRKTGLPLLIGETDRLILRELSEEDLPAVRDLKLQETETELLGKSAGQLCDAGFLRSYIRNQYPLFCHNRGCRQSRVQVVRPGSQTIGWYGQSRL